jgi:hypothetical protein
MVLDKELKTFKKRKSDFLDHYKDQFVLIHEEELVGSFTTAAEAYKAGIHKFGNVPFLIKQVTEVEPIAHVPAYVLGLLSTKH